MDWWEKRHCITTPKSTNFWRLTFLQVKPIERNVLLRRSHRSLHTNRQSISNNIFMYDLLCLKHVTNCYYCLSLVSGASIHTAFSPLYTYIICAVCSASYSHAKCMYQQRIHHTTISPNHHSHTNKSFHCRRMWICWAYIIHSNWITGYSQNTATAKKNRCFSSFVRSYWSCVGLQESFVPYICANWQITLERSHPKIPDHRRVPWTLHTNAFRKPN